MLFFLEDNMIKRVKNYFSRGELVLYTSSVLLIILSYALFGGSSVMTLVASLIGATSLLLNAKANPIGQFLTIVFSVFYGIISYSCAYYGEMITYLGMTAPMALFALISWIRHPYNGNHAEVTVNKLYKYEYVLIPLLTLAVTVLFYFILEYFNTANIIPSTVSVATSFAAVYLTFRRSKYYAIAYAMNDVVLVVLWILATMQDIKYISVIVCFVMFLANDLYGFINWHRIEKKQNNAVHA